MRKDAYDIWLDSLLVEQKYKGRKHEADDQDDYRESGYARVVDGVLKTKQDSGLDTGVKRNSRNQGKSRDQSKHLSMNEWESRGVLCN